MSLLNSIKPFWPLLFTFVLPRALGYLNALKTAYRTRPPPRPIPRKVKISLNILFCSILFFFFQSFPRGSHRDIQNIFSTTGTRLGVPTDVLFARLSTLRPNGILTATDEALRNVLNTKESRLLYLTYGPDTLLNCPFCHPSNPTTYTLYSLPTTILLSHLLHLTILGTATSAPLTGPLASSYRNRLLIPALVLLLLDVSLTSTPPPMNPFLQLINPQAPGPISLFALFKVLRPLTICALDALLALSIWTTTTNRFFLVPFLSTPDSTANTATAIPALQQAAQELAGRSTTIAQLTQQKLRAYAIARNTVLRDEGLKGVEEAYWREVKRREAFSTTDEEGEVVLGDDDEIWQDDGVQAAIARVYGSGGVNIPRARREAGAFVDGITRGLEEDGS